MIRPSLHETYKFAEGNTIVPVSLELFSDIKTPIELLKNIAEISDKYYLLESVEGGEVWGRYSFLGFEPVAHIICIDKEIEYCAGISIKEKTENPSDKIREILSQYKSPRIDYLPPFTGGFVGYFSYEYSKYAEKSLVFRGENKENFADCELMLFDKIIAYDHLRQKIIIIINIKTDNIETNYHKAVIELENIANMIKGKKSSHVEASKLMSDFKMLFSKEEYCSMVEKIKKYIFEGDIFQAVLSNRMEAEFKGGLLSTYRVLRTVNPSPYMFYVKCGNTEIAGASPETLVTVKNGKLSTFPIAGTRPRGKNSEEDKILTEELLKDEKELSEHNMLVDLGRNDLGKISKFGTVKVENYKKILKFSHVIHIATTVTGELKEGFDQFDAIEATLPAGTLSGAPKKRAMELLDDLEKTKRGIYGGAIGYIDFAGNMDLCIAIRMVVKKNGKVFVQSGGGIVADSDAEKEFDERMNKAQAVMEALKKSEEVDY